MEEPNDLFGKHDNILLIHDPDDPPPKVTYSDLHWWFLNRWAEASI